MVAELTAVRVRACAMSAFLVVSGARSRGMRASAVHVPSNLCDDWDAAAIKRFV